MSDIFNGLEIGIVSALIGVTSATVVSLLKERRDRLREINKIRSLLTDDFSGLYKEIVKDRQLFQNELDKMGTEEDLIHKLLSDDIDWSKIYSEYGIFYELHYWQAIFSSGSLLKLNKDEIRHVQAAYNSMDWYNTELKEIHKEMTDELREYLDPEETDAQYEDDIDKDGIRDLLKGYFEDVISMMNDCVYCLKELEKFSLLKV